MNPSDRALFVQQPGAVLACLRAGTPGLTWSAARRLLSERRVSVNGILCVDEGRRLATGDRIEVRTKQLAPVPNDRDVEIVHLDHDIVIANKPSGMLSLRHPGDMNWSQARKDRQPSLEECLSRLIASRQQRTPQLLAVQRLDRETSGLLVMALHTDAQRELVRQFSAHTVHRRYRCVVPGQPAASTIVSRQVRDRGDGLRGGALAGEDHVGPIMITHIRLLRSLGRFSEVECRLETGKTNQIRIQLSERGHPLCGDVKYRGPLGQPAINDDSGAPRLALHAAELGLVHPVTGETLNWERPWPGDIARWMANLNRDD